MRRNGEYTTAGGRLAQFQLGTLDCRAMGGVYIRYRSGPSAFGGVDRVNHAIAEILHRQFPVVDRPTDADLQICSWDWQAPAAPRRLFVDHGSFADAGFWAATAQQLSSGDTILVSSRVCLQIAQRMLQPPLPRLPLVPFFADSELFRPAEDRHKLRQALAEQGVAPADAPLLLAVSSYSRRKNLHLALSWFKEALEHLPLAQLVVIGRPSPAQTAYAAYLHSLVQELGLARRVRFLESMPQQQLARLMAASDLLLHLTTCRIENFGLVVAEALASGLPVLAADWGGLRDLVVDAETGLLAGTYLSRRGPRVDWRGTVQRAVSLLGDRKRWQAMSQAATRYAREQLGLGAFEQRLCLAVRQALHDDGQGERPLRLTARGEDLMFAVIEINRRHPELRSTSEEYRLLLEADRGELGRFLLAPAASQEHPPRLGQTDRPYPALSLAVGEDRVEVTDPAWPAPVSLTPAQQVLLGLADGSKSVAELSHELAATRSVTNGEQVLAELQQLVDEGLLCPGR